MVKILMIMMHKIQQFFEKRKQFSKKEEKTPQNAI